MTISLEAFIDGLKYQSGLVKIHKNVLAGVESERDLTSVFTDPFALTFDDPDHCADYSFAVGVRPGRIGRWPLQ